MTLSPIFHRGLFLLRFAAELERHGGAGFFETAAKRRATAFEMVAG